MTEEEWLTTADPNAMLAFLDGRAGTRKMRLFAVACCRRFPRFFPDAISQAFLHGAERYADGQLSWEDLWSAIVATFPLPLYQFEGEALVLPMPFWKRLPSIIHEGQFRMFVQLANELADRRIEEANDRRAVLQSRPGEEIESARAAWHLAHLAKRLEQLMQCFLLRDIFGNPFKPTPGIPPTVPGEATALARLIYKAEEFDELPCLADALEKAGCEYADMVNHCREPGLHVRGCWVLDLLLGKE
jgi:hypothetical protein